MFCNGAWEVPQLLINVPCSSRWNLPPEG